MPIVNVKLLGESTAEQKNEVIKGITDVLHDVLGKSPDITHVIVEDIPTDNWGLGGESFTEKKKG